MSLIQKIKRSPGEQDSISGRAQGDALSTECSSSMIPTAWRKEGVLFLTQKLEGENSWALSIGQCVCTMHLCGGDNESHNMGSTQLAPSSVKGVEGGKLLQPHLINTISISGSSARVC